MHTWIVEGVTFFKDLLGYPHVRVRVSHHQVGMCALLIPRKGLGYSSVGLTALMAIWIQFEMM